MNNMRFIKFFTDISYQDVPLVGGKNASLGEMIQQLTKLGIKVPLGFAITIEGYWHHINANNLLPQLQALLQEHVLFKSSNHKTHINIAPLQAMGKELRKLISEAPLPEDLEQEIRQAYTELSVHYKQPELDVALRSSASAEDLPNASFAGQQDTFLHIQGIDAVLMYTKKCMASLFTDRAIVYRIEQGFDHFKIGLSVGIQKMVRSDKASSGVIFSLDTDTGFKDAIVITSSYGLGENIVKGVVNPDEFHVHKQTLAQGYKPIIKKFLGSKEYRLLYQEDNHHLLNDHDVSPKIEQSHSAKKDIENEQAKLVNRAVSEAERHHFSITDEEILYLAKQTLLIEDHYSALKGSWCPMDIEWGKDGDDNELYILQARPETVYGSHAMHDVITTYQLKKTKTEPEIIVTGLSIGEKIAHGPARILQSIHEHEKFQTGDIIVTSMTDPDWVPLMKRASAIITDRGGRTCHAAIVSRELGIPAIVGTTYATERIKDGEFVTVDSNTSSEGIVFKGTLEYEVIKTPLANLPQPQVPLLLNIANPDRAYKLSFLPVSGVGLARIEFIITSNIKIHPMAACEPDKIKQPKVKEDIYKLALPYENPQKYFVDTLAQGIGMIAAAFYPREVIVRLSDFKSNEYRNLLAGADFEPIEENPMLGFRGAVRYCHPAYAPAFALECAALKKARNDMGFSNITLLVPFVRNINEAQCTLAALEKQGLKRGEKGLKILMMCEIPSNVICLEDFAPYFDGFSIGSNDLTQFTLAVDRDSAQLTPLFNETDPAVKAMFKIALEKAQQTNSYMSICGQAPSDFPEIAEFLIENGIDALSLNADSVLPFLAKEKK